MDTTVNHMSEGISLIKVKEETKCVLEAFLKRSLSHEEGKHLGHVGRTYHDPKKYSHGLEESREGPIKKSVKGDKKRSKELVSERGRRSPTFGEVSAQESNGNWNSLHEKINQVEEKKHGFKTNIKKLLRRHSQTKEKSSPAKYKSGSIHSKSRDSIENVLDDAGKDGSTRGDSLKRPKSPHPLLACTVANSIDSLAQGGQEVETSDKHSSQAVQKKHSRHFSFKNFLTKKNKDHSSEVDHPPVRPNFLPVNSCYEVDISHHTARETGKVDESEIYSLAAKKLDKLVKHKKLKSPVAPDQLPVISKADQLDDKPYTIENNNLKPNETSVVEDKEEVIRKLVSLLQEQAVVINDKINKDPFLRNTLCRLSYGSFYQLAEVFTNQTEVATDEAGACVSPELTKIALTMELTRKVAGINSHAVHTLMGYSLQYMDMFVPWLQKQGGWENIVSQEDFPDVQID
ncbi:bcl-2-like protein 12 [Rhinophrynus dorsalis]